MPESAIDKFAFPREIKDYYLYILIRTDVPSMTMGKRMAQVAHAANQFIHENEWRPDRTGAMGLKDWQESTPQGFGVTIVKGVNERDMRGAVEMARRAGFPTGITHDPSYPSSDPGHTYPLDTAAYVFGLKSELDILLYQFPLHP